MAGDWTDSGMRQKSYSVCGRLLALGGMVAYGLWILQSVRSHVVQQIVSAGEWWPMSV
jgi:hypothetical protein